MAAANAAWLQNLNPGSIRLIGPSGDVSFVPIGAQVVAGCAGTDFYVIKAANNAKAALSILLMAKTLGKTVSIWVDDPQPSCDTNGRPMFTHIWLVD
jgi:hypothetical protein